MLTQSQNVSSAIYLTPPGTLILVSPAFLKHSYPILVILSGSFISSSFLQSWKACIPISLSSEPCSKVALNNYVHPLNAPTPMS